MSEALQQAEEGTAVRRALPDYPSPRLPHRVPRPFGDALDALLPGLPDYAGKRKTALAWLNNRISQATLKNWRMGKRRVPVWAIDKIQSLLDAKIAELAHIRELLEAEKKKASG